METKVIAITGASGRQGRLIAENALREQAPETVILLTRDPAALADLAAQGAQVRRADFDDPATLPAAFAGAQAAVVVSTSHGGDRNRQHAAAMDAAVAAGVRHLAFTSMPRVDEPNHPAGHPAEEYWAGEQHMHASGVAWTALRNGPYAELNLVDRIEDSIVDGDLVGNTGGGGLTFVSRIDTAAVAYAVLTQPGHEGRTYDVTGPAAVSYPEVAATLTDVLGLPVAYHDLDDEQMAARYAAAGVPDWMVPLRVLLGLAIRDGFFGRVTTVVEDLTGRPPLSVRDVLEAHRDELRATFTAARG